MLAHEAVVGDTCAARRRRCGSVGKPRGHRGRVPGIRCVLYRLQQGLVLVPVQMGFGRRGDVRAGGEERGEQIETHGGRV